MYLRKELLIPAAEFLNSPLWQDIKKCLLDRRPDSPVSADQPHVAAAKGFERKGFEEAISALEALPFDAAPERVDPFNRPAILETKD